MDDIILKILTVVSFVLLGVGIMLGEETIREKTARSKSIFVRWLVYSIVDYGLMLLSIFLVAALKYLGEGFLVTTFAMWIFDFIIGYGLLMICLKSGQDLTLGREYRRSTDIIFSKSKIAGFFSLFIFLVKASVWDGPERAVEYYHAELNTMFKKILVVALMAILQAVFWTYIYTLGFEGIALLWQRIF